MLKCMHETFFFVAQFDTICFKYKMSNVQVHLFGNYIYCFFALTFVVCNGQYYPIEKVTNNRRIQKHFNSLVGLAITSRKNVYCLLISKSMYLMPKQLIY